MIIGSNLIFVKNLPSTNTEASNLLKTNDLPEGSVIYTNYQSAGKGQVDKTWESEDGKNLLISTVLYPSMVNPTDQFLISMTISLGVCDFTRRYVQDCSIKWPNDIYVKDDKIAGILIENSICGDKIEKTIAGIGLNINQTKFLSDAPNPASLSLLTGLNFDLGICLSQLTSDLDKRYKQLISKNYRQIRNEYISLLFRLNMWNDYYDKSGRYKGCIKTVSENGRLRIEKQSGEIIDYSFKEVEFIL